MALTSLAHFNPRSPHGERHEVLATGKMTIKEFQPTLPARGATSRTPRTLLQSQHFNPRSPHGERRAYACAAAFRRAISTHAPRTGSDSAAAGSPNRQTRFQPTLPARGATSAESVTRRRSRNFNPRSPHGERHFRSSSSFSGAIISTHAPRTGSDSVEFSRLYENLSFQPTLPARGATWGQTPEETVNTAFQPTLPARGATKAYNDATAAQNISTHAPRTGSDD